MEKNGKPVDVIHIGTQGWNYDDWVGAFYPRGTRAGNSLDLYVRAFDTVEVDSTFYAIPSEASINSWRSRAPNGFSYSLKMPQDLTHERRLHDCADLLTTYCDRIRGLGEKLATVLIQLPPDFSPRSYNAMERFLPLLPRDIRFAVEFRDRGWIGEEFRERVLGLFDQHQVAVALMDSPWIPREYSFQLIEHLGEVSFAYVRWLGPRILTDFSRVQIDRDRELADWAEAFAKLLKRVKVVYGYFDNYYQGHSPSTTNQFKKLIGQSVVEPEELVTQPSLF